MKNKTRIKLAAPQLRTRDDAEACMNELALTENNRRVLVARMDDEILTVTERYTAPLAEAEAAIRTQSESLRAWAEANREAFGKRKSLDLPAGSLGWRMGTPKLALLARWTWARVLEAIKNNGFQFVRVKEEVDKDAILSFVAATKDAADAAATEANVLRPIGVQVVQEEGFFVEPKLTG